MRDGGCGVERQDIMTPLRQQVLDWIKEDEQKLIDFYQDMVKAKSPNPPGDTREVMRLVSDFLDQEGLAFDEVTAKEHLPNLVATFDGDTEGKHLVLNGHVDVFPVGNEQAWDRDPWSGDIEDGVIHGRGAADMKGGTTAAIFTYRYLHRLRDKLAGKLSLMVVSDEETSGRWGTGYVLEKLGDEALGDCLLSGEPVGVKTIRFGEKGILQFTVEVRTRGAHGPYAHLSPSAINIMSDIMTELKAVTRVEQNLPPEIATRLADSKTQTVIDETMGEGTNEAITAVVLNIGTIKGGSKVNMVPSDCTIEVDIRVPWGVERDDILKMVHDIVGAHPEATIRDIVGGAALYSDPEHEMAELLSANVTALGYDEPVRIPMVAASDCRFWRERGVPALVYGTSPRNVSAPNESAVIEDFLHVVRVHALSALDYLNPE